MKLYLASGSPRRREILDLMHLPYESFPADADETLDAGIGMEAAGRLLATRKAEAAAARLAAEGRDGADALILAADTLVYLDGAPLGNPHTEDEEISMLRALSGRRHYVCTGVCLLAGGSAHAAADVTAVTMRAYSEDEVRAYVATGEPLDKAGAYGIQGIGAVLVEKIDGDFFTVMGLSPRIVYSLLRETGYPYFDLLKGH